MMKRVLVGIALVAVCSAIKDEVDTKKGSINEDDAEQCDNVVEDQDVEQSSSRIRLDDVAPPVGLGFPGEMLWTPEKQDASQRGQSVRAAFSDPEYIFTGSFGDVWKAKDQLKGGMEVAVKIFYVGAQARAKVDPGPSEWLTKYNVGKYGMYQELEDARKECTLMDDLMRNQNLMPNGASHICGCYREHVSDGTADQNPFYAHLFIVMEMCGSNLDKMWSEDYFRADPNYPYNAREVISQMTEGLHFTTVINQPPVIHRDIKPENVNFVSKGAGNKGLVKFIDWGLWDFGVVEHQQGSPGGTPGFIPPDCMGQTRSGQQVAFSMPAYASDIYATGIMYLMFLCKGVGIPGAWNWPVTGPVYQGPGMFSFSESDIIRKMQSSGCSTSGLEKDIKLISKMCAPEPEERIAPIDAQWEIYYIKHPEARPGQAVAVAPGALPPGTLAAYIKGSRPIKCKVMAYSASRKVYDLSDESGQPWRYTGADNVRRWTAEDEQSKGSFYQGDIVGYWSGTFNKWLRLVVMKVNPEDGTVDLQDPESGIVSKPHALPSQCRPWTADMVKDELLAIRPEGQHAAPMNVGFQQGNRIGAAVENYQGQLANHANQFSIGDQVVLKDGTGAYLRVPGDVFVAGGPQADGTYLVRFPDHHTEPWPPSNMFKLITPEFRRVS